MLGFERQLVFATHSVVTAFHPSSKIAAAQGASTARARAHNRHMADFCCRRRPADGRWRRARLMIPRAALVELDVGHRCSVSRRSGFRIEHPIGQRTRATSTSSRSGRAWPSRERAVRHPRRRSSPLHHGQGLEQQRSRRDEATSSAAVRTCAPRTLCCMHQVRRGIRRACWWPTACSSATRTSAVRLSNSAPVGFPRCCGVSTSIAEHLLTSLRRVA